MKKIHKSLIYFNNLIKFNSLILFLPWWVQVISVIIIVFFFISCSNIRHDLVVFETKPAKQVKKPRPKPKPTPIPTPIPTPTPPPPCVRGVVASCSNVDCDSDGLIEIRSIEMLNSVRFNLDGDGYVENSGDTPVITGCPSSNCIGYELNKNLDFQATSSYTSNTVSTSFTQGSGFTPIGNNTNKFTTIFHGNDCTIDNLLVNRSTTNYVGLFGSASSHTIRNIRLTNVRVTGEDNVGGLLGEQSSSGLIHSSSVSGQIVGKTVVGGMVGYGNGGTIISSYTTGQATISTNTNRVGGLVGHQNSGTITSCYSSSQVAGYNYVGGLIGGHDGGSITSSYAVGRVSGTFNVGGLLGLLAAPASVTASFWDTTTTMQSTSSGGSGATGLTTGNMQAACSPGVTTGVCALGNGFSFTSGEYPKVKKCVSCTGTITYGSELVNGQ